MPLENIQLKISTPTEPIRVGRGFYQIEEDILFVQVGQFSDKRRFFSYLECENIRLDFGREGRLIFIEIAIPNRHWPVDDDLTIPKIVEPADIRFLDFREEIKPPSLLTNSKRSLLELNFHNGSELLSYYLAESVVARVDSNGLLHSILIDNITDDMAGKNIRSFRKSNRPVKSYFS